MTTRAGTRPPRTTGRGKARRPRWRRWLIALLVLAVLALLAPIPWYLPRGSDFGMAWRLDGRLVVNEHAVDPPGRWTWLTAGRPPLLIELLFMDTSSARDLRNPPMLLRPDVNEPLAVAVGLIHAGVDLELGLLVEVVEPLADGLPQRAVLVELNGVPLTSEENWNLAMEKQITPVTFRTAEGLVYEAPGPELPYRRIQLVDEAPPELAAAIGGEVTLNPPLSWFRGLGFGRSHGLILALASYAEAVAHDVALGRHVAATGGIQSDGTVTPVGGLPAKAAAARRVGVDVFFYPAAQEAQLEGFDPGSMRMVGVSSLAEAISYLEAAI